MKKCIVISDSFKGTLSSLEICAIARESIPKFFPRCQVVTVPVTGTFGEPVSAAYAGRESWPSLRWRRACPWWGRTRTQRPPPTGWASSWPTRWSRATGRSCWAWGQRH